MDHIIDNIYLGSRQDVIDYLQKNPEASVGILSILDSQDFINFENYKNVKQEFYDISDVDGAKFKSNIHKIVNFIEHQSKNKNKVFIHCYAGINRSPSTTIAYLILKKKMPYLKALSFVEAKHHQTSPFLPLKNVLKSL